MPYDKLPRPLIRFSTPQLGQRVSARTWEADPPERMAPGGQHSLKMNPRRMMVQKTVWQDIVTWWWRKIQGGQNTMEQPAQST